MKKLMTLLVPALAFFVLNSSTVLAEHPAVQRIQAAIRKHQHAIGELEAKLERALAEPEGYEGEETAGVDEWYGSGEESADESGQGLENISPIGADLTVAGEPDMQELQKRPLPPTVDRLLDPKRKDLFEHRLKAELHRKEAQLHEARLKAEHHKEMFRREAVHRDKMPEHAGKHFRPAGEGKGLERAPGLHKPEGVHQAVGLGSLKEGGPASTLSRGMQEHAGGRHLGARPAGGASHQSHGGGGRAQKAAAASGVARPSF